MTVIVTLSAKWQVTVPKKFRTLLNLSPGARISISVRDSSSVVIAPAEGQNDLHKAQPRKKNRE